MFCKNSYQAHFLSSSSKNKKVLIFSYISGNGTSYISRNKNPEKILHISGSKFTSSESKKEPTLKKFLIFQEMNFLAPSSEKLLIF